MKKKILSVLLMLALITSMTVGCTTESKLSGDSGEEKTTEKKEGPYKFAFLPNTQNNTFQSSMNDKFSELAKEAGYEYTCLDPDYDLNTQLSQMSDVANQKFDAVFVIPVDSAGIRQGLQEIKDAGIPILNVDTAVIEDDRDLVETIIGTNAYQAGQLVGEQMVEDYPDGAKIAILDFPSNESCVDRVNGFLDGLGDSKDKFEIVAQQDGKAALDESMPIAEDIIQANADLDAFFCINDPSALGAAAAIKAANKKGEIGVYSIDASPDGKEALVDGTFTCVAAQVPLGIAESAFEKAVDLLNGKTIDKEIWLDSHLVTIEEAEETAGQWQ
ncbi:ribose transport system substrate-binding protein [Lachnospiraceae bacterium PF1-21]|uniref:Sugar ABC transporter substrate-binding protein n=1 Tax=Ohessyouella blattaphilus TaxID=2949333 RepID=A0ABT1EJS8_9FIRM|nr:sugar ABC transporter substrate-binding protein [Ohessyouella blattaphilus]MCP1110796.1 sugar ABC transporter substrate-binding protein [Ohessyouella blattaphilus]MCR8564190.1 sugar ABC transporter substrate-binding protein [Ohessyouella blattaphilus]MDL2250050.1 sugar ABC transporter substrate-binding protein [Lachnospiraceae bacterium OttesenSCG-928-J05]